MPRVCTVCRHPDRNAIDTAIVTHVSNRNIAAQHGLTSSGVWRHGKSHLRETLVKATTAAEVVHADSLLDKVKGYIVEAEAMVREARTDDDKRTALQALDRAMSGVTLLAKLSGDLDERPNVNVLLAAPEWRLVQVAIFEALETFPEARAAVASGLMRLEGGSA